MSIDVCSRTFLSVSLGFSRFPRHVCFTLRCTRELRPRMFAFRVSLDGTSRRFAHGEIHSTLHGIRNRSFVEASRVIQRSPISAPIPSFSNAYHRFCTVFTVLVSHSNPLSSRPRIAAIISPLRRRSTVKELNAAALPRDSLPSKGVKLPRFLKNFKQIRSALSGECFDRQRSLRRIDL